ncbi:tyrosine kinase-like protein, putative [Plasmodium vinckei vinckei]|uniref:Tyrosine kinase-like protein, putative n=1 Tax=Plasmodium vinckei vinckei TaxID=54757 RepID=A0A449BZA8_PLAVN|nr:tyrosine kinase-like protein, putative [Plasmodium vinckei vinckei]KEG05058.1 serine/threonine protein kinase [Plasmodium vinckei vinckei]VEV58711.1 tyrosine kinase-like protein, putative [Plasmodium vinckei vinckei]
MNETNLCGSLMLLKNSDKLFYDNLINLDERLKLNNNFNENRYNEVCDKKFIRNSRRFKTEPPKNISENSQLAGYSSFFQNIFSPFSKSVSYKNNEEDENNEINKSDTEESEKNESPNFQKNKKDSNTLCNEKDLNNKLYINGLPNHFDSNLSNKKYELTSYTESYHKKMDKYSMSDELAITDKNDPYISNKKDDLKKYIKKREKETNILDNKIVKSYVISEVFLKKNIKSLVVHNTGGIDIELIENENPEFLYHTYTGNRISNIYYEYEDKLKGRNGDETKGSNNKLVWGKNDKNKIIKDEENDKLSCSYDYNKNCDINSSISSLSINVSEKYKYKKYYYIGETINNMRNGWGMLVYNDRVIFEGEYKMDNAIGYFIKYNEYSTEIGYRSPISIKSVIIMSDHDNFIIQNKCENLNNNNKNEDEDIYRINSIGSNRTDLLAYKMGNRNLDNILICNNGFENFENIPNSDQLKYKNNSYSSYRIDKDCISSFEKDHSSIKKFSTLLYKNNSISKGTNANLKLNSLKNNNSNNLNVISSFVRRNSKHKTTPAQSLNYLKPPNMNFIKNNIFSNKNSISKNEKILTKKKKKESTTAHTFSPINIIVTSFDSDDDIGEADTLSDDNDINKDKVNAGNCNESENNTTRDMAGLNDIDIINSESKKYENYFDITNEGSEIEGDGYLSNVKGRKNTLDVEIDDEYKNLICANINNDNFVIKNNEIEIFEEFIENQKRCSDKEWECSRINKIMCEEGLKVDKPINSGTFLNEGDFTISTDAADVENVGNIGSDYADILDSTPDPIDDVKNSNKFEINKAESYNIDDVRKENGKCDEKKNEVKYCKVLKNEMRRKMRGATFPETHDDRQKNCFLFIDDYLTSNDYKFDIISNDVRLRASDYNKWSVNMLYNFLKMIGLKKEAYLFKINKIRGYHILKLTDSELKKLNVNNPYTRKYILSVFRFLVNSIDNADPLSLNFNTSKKFSFNKIPNISNNDITILNKVGGGSYAQVFRGKYKGITIACKLFVYNTKDLSEESYCESYISTPRSTHQYIFPKIFKTMQSGESEIGDTNRDIVDSTIFDKYVDSIKSYTDVSDKNDTKVSEETVTNLCTLQRNKKIKKMANLEIFRYFPTPVKYRNYEAKILYSLQECEHVIKLLGVCSLGEGEESLILQYCSGGSLEKYIYHDERKKINKQNKHLSRPKIVKIFQQVAKGMYSIHSNNFFHRDIKLSNILLDENQNAFISDFGLSTYFSLNDSPSAYAIYGNIFYAAPEVLKGEGFFKESDVWSFGVSLWEALTKKIAYDGISSSETFCKISSGELYLPIPNDIPKDISDLLRSTLEYDFTKRPLFDVIARKLEHISEAAEKRLHFDMISFLDG